MSTADEVARHRYDERQRLVDAASRAAADRWARVDSGDIAASWRAQLAEMYTVVSGAQFAAAGGADEYLAEVLAAQDLPDLPGAERVNPRAFAGVASDGRDLMSLLYQPAITALAAIGAGTAVGRAMAGGWATLDMIVRTQVADAGRGADSVAMARRKHVGGYVRLAVGRSCSRCVILAGKFYRWNTGFARHPRCDCVHVPTTREEWRKRDWPGDNPAAIFRSMSRAEQDRVFTNAGAQAIRDGADIGQVVNARRGMYTAGGQKLTTESTTKRGVFRGRGPRLMPEEIYRRAGGNRDEAIRLLRQNGYIVPGVTVPKAAETFASRAGKAATGNSALNTAPINLAKGVPTLLPGRTRTLTGEPGLTSDEHSFLRQYKGTAYDNINGALRRERGILPGGLGFEFYREATAAIDAAMARSALTADVATFRGIRSGSAVFGSAWERSLAGAEWTEWAYLSTSADRAVAEQFLSSSTGATMRILVPRGTHGIVLSDDRYESEILLRRGLRLRVVSDTGPGPGRVIEVEVLS